MSILSGTLGAVLQDNSQKDSTKAQQWSGYQNLALQQRIDDRNQENFKPFLQAGQKGIADAQNFDLMQGVGPAVNYDQEYTDKLGDYKQSAGYTAQSALGQQALQRQLNARGLNYGATGASAGAELDQKLVANDFDKYRGDLAQRYQALQGEYALRRDVNQNQYTKLMDMVKVGQGAAGSVGQGGSQYGQQAAGAFNSLGQAVNPNSSWSGIGGASAQTAATGLKGYEMGQKSGWWGGTPAAGGAAATAAGAGEAGTAAWGGTMVEASAPAWGAEGAAWLAS